MSSIEVDLFEDRGWTTSSSSSTAIRSISVWSFVPGPPASADETVFCLTPARSATWACDSLSARRRRRRAAPSSGPLLARSGLILSPAAANRVLTPVRDKVGLSLAEDKIKLPSAGDKGTFSCSGMRRWPGGRARSHRALRGSYGRDPACAMRRPPLDGAFRHVALESPARRLPAAFFFAGHPDGRHPRNCLCKTSSGSCRRGIGCSGRFSVPGVMDRLKGRRGPTIFLAEEPKKS